MLKLGLKELPIALILFILSGVFLLAQYDVSAPQGGDGYQPSGYAVNTISRNNSFNQYQLSPQDLLRLKIYQEPDMDSQVRVEADGNIILPLLGRVKVGGLTVIEAQEYVQALYNADYFVEPQVTLLVIEFRERKLQVIGQVNRPGWVEIPLGAELSLTEAISAAGGFNLRASQKEVQVTRRTADGRSNVSNHNVKEILQNPKVRDPVLQEGDTVYVKESVI